MIVPSASVALSVFNFGRSVSFTKLGLFAMSSSVIFCMVCTNSPASSAAVMNPLTLLARVELVN